MDTLILLVIVVAIVILAILAIDYFAGGIGGDARLWLVIKGLVVVGALLYVIQRTGALA